MSATLDVYTGASAHWNSTCIALIEYLISLGGSKYTYVSVAAAICIPTAEVSRFLRDKCYERRDYEWLLQFRRYNPVAYRHYLQNSEIRERTDEKGKKIKELYVNFSKHSIFLANCRLRNVRVEYQTIGSKRLVHLFDNQEDMRTKIYYEIPTQPYEALEHGLEDVDDTAHNSTVEGESHE